MSQTIFTSTQAIPAAPYPAFVGWGSASLAHVRQAAVGLGQHRSEGDPW